jgi:fucose permease
MSSPPRRVVVAIAFAAFVSLGLPDGLLGVAWPSIRKTFGLPLSQLGAILFAVMAGYLGSSFASGAIVARHGVGPLLAWSNVLVAASCVGFALAPAWPVMLACGLVAGAGAGAIDAGINVYAAERFSPRLVSWLHASWSAGAALGPLIMTAVLGAGLAWRWGYGVAATIVAAMALSFFATIALWSTPSAALGDAQAAHAPSPFLRTLRRPAVWAHMAVFFLYTGLEGSAGQWAYSLLTEARQVAPGVAGTWVGGYWASLAAGRLVCGLAAHRFTAAALLRAAMACAVLAASLVWADRGPAATVAGLALLGFSLAPIFPMLIASTPARLGAGHAAHAIGFQVSAACLGAAAVPGAAGLVARWHGLEAIPAVLLANAVALWLLHESTNVFAGHPRGG